MDSITHLAVGALIGQAGAGKTLGKRAMLFGAIAQSLPDVDFVAAFWLSPSSNLLAHRGFTHSILFTAIVSILLALIFSRWNKHSNLTLWKWFLFFSIQMSVHLFIDVMNAYGVGLLEPFSHNRFSLNVLFVADPFFSLWPGMACIALLVLKSSKQSSRIKWIRFGISGAAIYLVLAVCFKVLVTFQINDQIEKQSTHPSRIIITPTPLNTLLWYVVAENDSGYFIGYRSLFDDGQLNFTFHPRNEHLLHEIPQDEDLQHLIRFSQGYYTIANKNGKLIFSDIRFGQTFGWIDPHAEFGFQYQLQQADANTFVLQRGRFANISQKNIKATLKRIAGN